MDSAIISRIAQDSGVAEAFVAAAVSLFESGATVPFVTHYRRGATGGLDPLKVRAVYERYGYYREILERRAALLQTATDQGKLSDEWRNLVESVWTRTELEDLSLQFKPRKKTRATEALEKGLEALADHIWNQEEDAWSLEEHIQVCVNPEKHLENAEQVVLGVVDILAERIAENVEFRKHLREALWTEGVVVSTVVPAKAEQKTKYNMYYNRREPVATVPSHRVLAIRRGTKEGVLTSAIEGDTAKAIEFLLSKVIKDRNSAFAPILDRATRDSYHRILRPLIETEVRARLKERADREAIRIFQDNLSNLLMSPPAGPLVVMGMDPGKGDECRVAVVDATGRLLEEAGLNPKEDAEATRTALKALLEKYQVQAVAFGNSPPSRALESIIRGLLGEEKPESLIIASVNDAGIAIYSASRTARDEFPEMNAAGRCAVSIARRLQDPMSELVKIDPKLIGVGQYQHDVDQKELHRSLVQAVQTCVNSVGVNVNTGGIALLKYVAGIGDKLARRIVAVRHSKGDYPTRESVRALCALEDDVWRQAAGFIRVVGGENPLDATAVHPESYGVVEKMAAGAGVPPAEFVTRPELITAVRAEDLVDDTHHLQDVEAIRRSLIEAGRDPRGSFVVPQMLNEVKSIEELKEGMDLRGVVTNVTNFGAFVDVGVQQDGLVHLSQMSNRFIRDPREAVKVGDLVQVKVISVEVETRRIGLSMKALLPAIQRPKKKRRPARPQPPAAAGTVAPAEGEATPAGEARPHAPRPQRPPRPAGPRRDGSRPEGPRREGRPDGQRPGGRPEGPRRDAQGRGRPPRRPDRPSAPQGPREITTERRPPEAPAGPPEPERTMQEKIALLQTKFRSLG